MLHPAMAETVNYVIARSDVQSTFFLVLSFILYTYSAFCRKTFLYLLPLALGALAKPTTVMFAPLLLLYILMIEENQSLSGSLTKTGRPYTWAAIKKTIPAFIFFAVR
jgi:protein O-mannosyl-transferase